MILWAVANRFISDYRAAIAVEGLLERDTSCMQPSLYNSIATIMILSFFSSHDLH